MFLGVNMFLACLRLILPELKASARMSSEKVQQRQLYYNYNSFSGHLEKKYKTVDDIQNTPGFDSAFI